MRVPARAQRANVLYRQGRFSEALALYNELGDSIGVAFFAANVNLCQARLKSTAGMTEKRADKINIAFITDRNYALATYVAIFSLKMRAHAATQCDVHVLCLGLSAGELQEFKLLEDANLRIHLLVLNETYDEYIISKDGFHVSPAAIVKFRLPSILKHLDKVIYLDGDIIVKGDLKALFETELAGRYAAVVQDIKPKFRYNPSILKKLSIESHRSYFNSGVLVLNLRKLREDGMEAKLFDYRKTGVNYFMDQDALNVVFRDNVEYLPLKYNFMVTLPESFTFSEIKRHYELSSEVTSLPEVLESASIVHFASKNKPWKGFKNEYSDLWVEYFLLSNVNSSDLRNTLEISNLQPQSRPIVSLTSYPPRIQTVHLTIKSLLSQRYAPAAVYLWLATEQFPRQELELPQELLDLLSSGLQIKWCHDIRSFKKLVPTIRLHPDSIIVTADDDIIYKPDWLLNLAISFHKNPAAIHCCRAHKISFNRDGEAAPYKHWKRDVKSEDASFENFFTGCGGVLYPPYSLHPSVLDESAFMTICPHGDDIWFWGMAILNGTKIQIVKNSGFSLDFIPDSQEVALWRSNDSGGENDRMLRAFLNTYPEILQNFSEVQMNRAGTSA